jgi:hypothetical protein
MGPILNHAAKGLQPPYKQHKSFRPGGTVAGGNAAVKTLTCGSRLHRTKDLNVVKKTHLLPIFDLSLLAGSPYSQGCPYSKGEFRCGTQRDTARKGTGQIRGKVEEGEIGIAVADAGSLSSEVTVAGGDAAVKTLTLNFGLREASGCGADYTEQKIKM